MATTLLIPLTLEGLISKAAAGTTVLTAPASYNCRVECTVANASTTTADYFRCYKLPEDASMGNANMIIPYRNLAAGATDPCDEVLKQLIEPGATLVFISGAGTVLNVTGRAWKTLKTNA